MIGSHNSFSYLPPKNLWGKITRRWNKCQDKSIVQQYEAGVQYFDVHIRYIGNNWHYVHNKVDYGICNIKFITSFFGNLKDKVYVRLILDERSKPKNADLLTSMFISVVDKFASYENISLSYIIYWNWRYNYVNSKPIDVEEYHASVSAPWYKYLLGTKWFAKHYNKYAKKTYYDYSEDNERVLLLDYV